MKKKLNCSNNKGNIQLPVINDVKCISCDKCLIACPNGVIIKASDTSCQKCIKYCLSMEVPCNPNNYIFCYEKCDGCGICVTTCENEAIYWYRTDK